MFIIIHFKNKYDNEFKELQTNVLNKLEIPDWDVFPYYDFVISVKSRQALENYDLIKFFKEKKDNLSEIENIIKKKLFKS